MNSPKCQARQAWHLALIWHPLGVGQVDKGRSRVIFIISKQLPHLALTDRAYNGPDRRSTRGQGTGDLTIKGISKETAFQAAITPVSGTRIEGSASTTISRSDYDLSIPSVPRVASVEESLILEFDFVAVPTN